MPADKKPRLASFSLSVKRLTRLGTIINKVHQPSKKISRVNNPRVLPPKMIPNAIMAIPHIIGFACFIFYSFMG